MEKRQLGRTGDMVTSVCLGTMTWGEQNTEAEAHEQLDYAIGEGINFIDTAEMYPVPGRAATQGRTESYIGSWIKARGKRDDFYLATKITGRSGMTWTRASDKVTQTRHTEAQIDEAVENSLKRLQTDYIDLYQLHWPDRALPAFGYHSYHDYDEDEMVPLFDILTTLSKHIKKGNIRHIGVSNESAWGMMKFLQLAEKHNLPRIASIQNIYSLISRRFDYGQAEVALREDVGLLTYSVLCMGYLTGKYEKDIPKGSRKDLFPEFLSRYNNESTPEAVLACNEAARDLGLTPAQFALKFAESRSFVTSSIIGATSLAQLKDNIDAHNIEWTRDMEKAAHDIHNRYLSPVC